MDIPSPEIREYESLLLLPTFQERLRYLSLPHAVGVDIFGSERLNNQAFYHSSEWHSLRNAVIARDWGCDLAIRDRPITGHIIVHHMVPLTPRDFSLGTEFLLAPKYLITVSPDTHRMIHYGIRDSVVEYSGLYENRTPHDTCPWRKEAIV